MNQGNKSLSGPTAILLGSLIIAVAILISGGIIPVKSTSKSDNSGTGVVANPTVTAQQPQQPQQPTSAKVSIGDGSVLGNKDAQITMIEFSDYECPFCKRHFIDVYPSLKKDYIDTGKVKLVFRDYPLPFHEPMATFEANAAKCAREQRGDSVYYKFHDAMFNKTKSNGNGLTKEDVYQFASDLGLNQADFKSCADSLKYAEKIKKDAADGAAAGVSGTPSFFIGKSDSSGTIIGQIIVGAQPYTNFKTIIDAKLAK